MAVRRAVKGFRRLTETSCRDTQQVHSLGMGCCAMAMLRQLSPTRRPAPPRRGDSRRFHGSVSSARTGWSLERWNAAQPQTDRASGIGLSRGVPIASQFHKRHQPIAHRVDGAASR